MYGADEEWICLLQGNLIGVGLSLRGGWSLFRDVFWNLLRVESNKPLLVTELFLLDEISSHLARDLEDSNGYRSSTVVKIDYYLLVLFEALEGMVVEEQLFGLSYCLVYLLQNQWLPWYCVFDSIV